MVALPLISEVLRTPEECFFNLPDYPFAAHYTELGGLRIAHVDEGPRDGPIVLLMHGEPAWSYLYRKMIPVLVSAGLRVIAPDLVGFGRSDKPAHAKDYSYFNHVQWMKAWVEANQFEHMTFFGQDWGSLVGLRVVAEMPDRFDRVVLANGGLPTGTTPVPFAFNVWRAFARFSPWFPIGKIVKTGCTNGLTLHEVAAYDAPFPTSKYSVGARIFPGFVPTTPTDPERANNEAAWEVFKKWNKPFLTLFSTRDPITKGGEVMWQKLVPGAQGQPHTKIRGAAHFLQEDKGSEVAEHIVKFIRKTK
ncbi:MAG: haloalkane dehalogenase [Comamonadaceae bacterium]